MVIDSNHPAWVWGLQGPAASTAEEAGHPWMGQPISLRTRWWALGVWRDCPGRAIPACVWKEMSYLQGPYEPLVTPAGPAARNRSASAENRWVRVLLALAAAHIGAAWECSGSLILVLVLTIQMCLFLSGTSSMPQFPPGFFLGHPPLK